VTGTTSASSGRDRAAAGGAHQIRDLGATQLLGCAEVDRRLAGNELQQQFGLADPAPTVDRNHVDRLVA
jgi:hypothetical protein